MQYRIFVIQNAVLNTGKYIPNFEFFKKFFCFSVIHPEEYEKRLLKFLFDKVFIDSNQTLEELLASPILPDLPPEEQYSQERRESFEMIQTTDVLQNLTIQPLTTTDSDKMFIESTAL